ncbi:MAG: ABC transporter permease [Bacillati bacterium ANGP1]|uniref:ABC transporter permease n=1 Tax=Candidatus Segetimicrobium genomatis TaxID=2569760 RepID=A0A537L397_9BACT|nr:MAG: ABC transporter permease [Terrabacteria group bacterium ANGP1]
MRAFLTRRLLLLVPTLLGVTLATFLMLHLTPGDPVTIMLGEFASASDVARLRAELGLDRPIVVQYLKFLGRAVRGDLGSSIRSRRPVQEEIAERLPPTMVLALAAQVLAVCAGITAGVTAAAARRPSVDSAIVAVTLVGLSMPTFWSGLLLILLFSLTLGWLPITASGGLRALILPAVTLAAPAAAVLARVTRASVLEVLRQDYVRTARAKGVSERLVVYRHALRNALIPVLTVAALQFAGLVAGAVIVESVFSRPGLGRLAVTAILSRDFPLAQGIVLVVASVYVFVNVGVDLVYGVLDPRIRYQ